MKTVGLIFVVLISSKAFALETYLEGCAIDLAGRQVEFMGRQIPVAPGQVVLTGELVGHDETGIADMTLWAVRDQFLVDKVTGNQLNALIPLRKGDHVFMKSPDGQIIEGYYHQYVNHDHPSIGASSYHSINQPELYRGPDLKEILIHSADFAPMFFNGTRILAVQTPDDYNKYHFRMLSIPYQKYRRQLENLARFIRINSELTLELAHFERLVWGKLQTEIQSNGALNLRVETESGQVFNVAFKDRLIVLDQNDKIISDWDLSRHNIFPVGDAARQYQAHLSAAHRVALIQRD